MKEIVFLSIFFIAVTLCSGELGCPDPSEIAPCTCYRPDVPGLTCRDITNAAELREVFLNSQRYIYYTVHLYNCALHYIPHEIFDNVGVYYLYIINGTLNQLFDELPKPVRNLEVFHIERTKIVRGFSWEYLSSFTELKEIDVNGLPIQTLGSDFSQYVNKDLTSILLEGTKTKSIKPGAFQDLLKLETVDIIKGQLTELKRDFFPRPSEAIRTLSFSENRIRTISAGMFTDMPNLVSVDLTRNRLTYLDAAAFGGSASHLNYLDVHEDPLRCDCRIQWLLRHQPQNLVGVCASPSRFQGRSLNTLTTEDLHCLPHK